jgi:hypothetical protein
MMMNKECTLRDAEKLVSFGVNMDIDRAITTLRCLKRHDLSSHDYFRALCQAVEQRFGDPWGTSILSSKGCL